MFRHSKLSAVALALAAIITLDTTTTNVANAQRSDDRWNWSHNIEFTAQSVARPEGVQELQTLLKTKKGPFKVVGTAHSFNDIADTPGTQISLENFTNITVDKERGVVKFGAGITYTKLIEALSAEHMAIENLPSLPHLNVVGSVVTGTHGSGIHNRAMSGLVTELTYIDGNGTSWTYTLDDKKEFFRQMHTFGMVGIITEMSMRIIPEFAVTKCIYKDVAFDTIFESDRVFRKLQDSHGYISYFTDWEDPVMNSIWLGNRHDETEGDFTEFLQEGAGDLTQICEDGYLGGTLTKKTHPVPGRSSEPCVSSGRGMWN